MNVLIPKLIAWMVKREHHYNITEAMASSMEKYLFIMLMLVFGVGLIGLQIIGIMIEWAWDDWLPTFGEQIIFTGDFFLVLIMQMAFFGQGFGLLALGKLILGKANEKLANTELETKRAWSLAPWDLGVQYS